MCTATDDDDDNRYLKRQPKYNFQEVIITRLKWLVPFVIDLNPYELLLDKMEDELARLGVASNRVTQKCIREEKYIRLLDPIELETAVLEV